MNAQSTYTVGSDGSSIERQQQTVPVGRNKTTVVSLTANDRTVEYVVTELTRQARLKLLYDVGVPAFSKKVSVKVVKMDVMSALAVALRGTGLDAKLAPDGETVVIRLQTDSTVTSSARSTVGTIAGRVTDSATGRRLPQVVITVNGTKLSATTQADGTFRITEVPAARYMVSARVLGYASKTLSVVVDSGQTRALIFALHPTPTALSEVVTTATGRQRRVEIGNDITRINADSIMNVAPVATVTDLLATRVPGLIVMPTSGLPGASSRLRLRGTSSMSVSNDPIVIIDGVRMYADQSGDRMVGGKNVNSIGSNSGVIGVANSGNSSNGLKDVGGNQYNGAPSPIDQLDPNSIESIEVFKGPSASALYGPDAANGVIVITTKRGRVGPARLNVAANLGRTNLPGRWPVNYYRFGHLYQSTGPGFLDGGSRLCSPFETCITDSVVAFQALNESRFSPFETGTDRGISLAVSGGTAAMTYALTGSASSRDGILRLPDIEATRFQATRGIAAPEWMRQPDQYTTYSGTSKIGIRIGQDGNSTLTNTVFYSQQQQPPDLGTLIQGLSTVYLDPAIQEMPTQSYKYMTRVKFNTLRSTNVLNTDFQPWRWLPLKFLAGLDMYTVNNNSVLPRGYAKSVQSTGFEEGDTTGVYAQSRGSVITRSLNLSTVVPVPRAQVSIGFSYDASSNTAVSIGTTNLPLGVLEPTQFIYLPGEGPTQMSDSRSTFGWYLAPTFRLSSRLYFNPGLRFDGSSTTGNRAGLSALPKLDFSWLAVDRPDQPPLFGVLTQLRPRVAFGVSTVQPRKGNSLRLFQPRSVIPTGGTTPVTVLTMTSLGNTKLRAERSREFEGGFDADLWNSRVNVTLSGYHKMRYDAIVGVPLSPSVNDVNISANVGNIRNTGINATVDARLFDSRTAEWRVSTNVTRNRGLVVSLVDGQEQVVVGGGPNGRGLIVYRPGYPPNSAFLPRIASYFDTDGDGVLSKSEIQIADDSVYMGAPEPTYQLDLSTTISLLNRRLQISTALSYQDGLTQYNQIGLGASNGLNDPTIPLERQAEIVAACSIVAGCSQAINMSQIGGYQTVNLLRWSTVSIGYHMPTAVAQRFGGSTLFVALQGSNLALLTNYRGKDPSVSGFSTGNLITDSGQVPTPRSFQVRVTWGR